LTRRIFAAGYQYAFLYAEADNPVSNRIYEKLGYEKTDDFIEYHRCK
jgi:predicted GNAT family acetyltransferase